jgi:hypothetical protein
MVGSPPCPAQVAGRCKSYCNAGDNICEGSGKSKGGAGGAPGGAPRPPKGKGEDAPAPRLRRDLMAPAAECVADVQERGHQPAYKGEGAHLAYNKDGYYIKAAACYVLEQWKKSGAAA